MAPTTPFPFHAIFLLDGNSGVELTSFQITKLHDTIDVDAVAGLFSALEMFMNNMAYSNHVEVVQEINFQGLRICYERFAAHPPVLAVGVSNKFYSSEVEHGLLRQIAGLFHTCFQPLLINYQGNVRPFATFHTYLAHLVEKFRTQEFRSEKQLAYFINTCPLPSSQTSALLSEPSSFRGA